MLRLVFALLAVSASVDSFAYGTVTGRVLEVRIDHSGRGMVTFDQQVTGGYASCRIAAYASSLAFDTNTAGGKSIMALVLTAKSSGNTVTAIGRGTCDIYNGSYVEDWDYGSSQ